MRFREIGQQGLDLAASGNYRRGADKCIQAVFAAPNRLKNAKFRYYFFFMYCMILREMHFEATEKELRILEKKFLYNSDQEPPHFCVCASFCLGVVLSSRGDRARAADAYREGIDIATKRTTPEQRSVMVTCDDGDFPASYFIDSQRKSIENNLNIMLGRGGRSPGMEFRNDGTPMPVVGAFERVTLTARNCQEYEDEDIIERARFVGGENCDHCQKSKECLGLDKLSICGRCQFMYYCSKDCQIAAWRAGHKQECRKPGQFKSGDYVKLAGLPNDRMNGQIVKVVEATDDDMEPPRRWKVEFLHNGKTLTVAPGNLKHIRPRK